MSLLASGEKQFLLQIARRSLNLTAENAESFLEFSPDELAASPASTGGAFVTLRRGKRLRGCIGQLVSDVPLVEVVAYCAKAAALNDPRFAPVARHEVSEIEIELSVLSSPHDVAPDEIEPGKHGLIVSRGAQRGLLLPQVASEHGWSGQRFLEETCAKGGLEPNAWRHESTRIQAFNAEVFSESSVRRETEEAAASPRGSSYSSST
ncbi:MAG TPA: AmmeMemoRadiSam system protein A [Candidatus Acidoferrales bacterium]|jgi:AmmeMemoRadiSam system protein A|nr:AmmeMemoRadiSam system protein A [Candidatus Acidoferrales bacterium]